MSEQSVKCSNDGDGCITIILLFFLLMQTCERPSKNDVRTLNDTVGRIEQILERQSK
ncbi:MAG: hypothetical protein ABFD89_04725 [Bryobacteraceae bacterium]